MDDNKKHGFIKEEHLAVVLIVAAIICTGLFVIISVKLVSERTAALREALVHSKAVKETVKLQDDADGNDTETDSINQDADSADRLIVSSAGTDASDRKTGEMLVDFCDDERFNRMLEHVQDHQILLTVWHNGEYYESDDKDTVVPVIEAVKTVRIGEPTLQSIHASDALSFSFYDVEDDSIFMLHFFKNVFSYNTDGTSVYYTVPDWGELEDIDFEFKDGNITIQKASKENSADAAYDSDIPEDSLINTEYSGKLRSCMESGDVPESLEFKALTYSDEKITVDDPLLIAEIYNRMSIMKLDNIRPDTDPDYSITFYMPDGSELEYGFDQFYHDVSIGDEGYYVSDGEYLRQLMGAIKKGEIESEFTYPEESGRYYQIKIGRDEGNNIKSFPEKARAGETIMIQIDDSSDTSFTVNGVHRGCYLSDGVYVFSMPAEDVELFCDEPEEILDGPGTPGS